MTNPIQKLREVNSLTEIWWDSSPLVYNKWFQSALLRNICNRSDYFKDINYFDGVTTNPKLTAQVLEEDPLPLEENKNMLEEFNHLNDGWSFYKKINELGARNLLDKFDQTYGSRGFFSAQVNPFNHNNPINMVLQGVELSNISRNVMVKVPGTKEGIYVLRILTSLGISTNSTLNFSFSQINAAAEAVKEGKELGEANGIDYSNWKSVITLMIGRVEDHLELTSELKRGAFTEGKLDQLTRWAGIAIAKKCYSFLKENNFPSKLLISSLREGPTIDGKSHIWHIEKLAGGDLVFTLNPKVLENVLTTLSPSDIEHKINDPVPQNILDFLLDYRDFKVFYQDYGQKSNDFSRQPAALQAIQQFSQSMRKFINLNPITFKV